MRSRFRGVIGLLVCGLMAFVPFGGGDRVLAGDSETSAVTVYAAASLKNALDAIAAAYGKSTGRKAVVSYAASSALAKQIEQAAPADIFISADTEWMDYLAGKKLIADATRSNLAGNLLVLIAPADSNISLVIAPVFDLAGALGDGRLALASVQTVPAGKYAKASLEKLGVWALVEKMVAEAENVRAALALVARGEAAMGIVYRTDAMAEPKVKIIATFPGNTHPPIVYPAALTASAKDNEAASQFLAYLKSPEAQAVFAKEGFLPPP